MTEDERTAHRIHKVRYDLALEAPPFRVVGTVYLYPGRRSRRGSSIARATCSSRSSTRARCIGESLIEGGATSVILLNRYYLRGVEQIDSRTGERAEPLPG